MRMMKTEIIKSTSISIESSLSEHEFSLMRKLATTKEVEHFMKGNDHLITCLTLQELQELRAGLNDFSAKLIKMLEELDDTK